MNTKTITSILCAFSVSATVAFSQTTLADSSGPINDNTIWTGDTGPVSGDTGIWDLNGQNIDVTGNVNFNGGTLLISSGSALRKNVQTTTNVTIFTNDLQLDAGGVISNFDSGNRAFTVNVSGNLTLNGGTFEVEGGNASRTINVNASNVLGSGTVNYAGVNNGPSTNKQINFTGSDLSNFTGDFSLTNNGVIQFGEITTGSFGLSLADTSLLINNSNVSFTTLTINGDSIAAGTYAVSDFTVAQQARFSNGGGLITVVPEPSTYALIIGVLVLGFTAVRRFKKS